MNLRSSVLVLLAVVTVASCGTTSPQRPPQPQPAPPATTNRLIRGYGDASRRPYSVFRPRIFDGVASSGIFGIAVYLGELVAGTLLAMLVLYLAGVVYGVVTGKKTFNFSLEGRSVEDVKYVFDVAQQAFEAIENFQTQFMNGDQYKL